MPESNEHRHLVHRTLSKAQRLYPQLNIMADLQEKPGDPMPPMIEKFRPDLYGHSGVGGLLSLSLIAEAKTSGDLEKDHTDRQLSAFIRHLERQQKGVFILAVPGSSADRARTILHFKQIHGAIRKTDLLVFDTHDFWRIDRGSLQWHLI